MQIPVTNQYFSGNNNNLFSIKPTIVCVKISEKKSISFSSLRSPYNKLANRKILWKTWILTTFQSGWNNGIKLWVLMSIQGHFQVMLPLIFDFADEVVVQGDIPDVKILF